MVVAPRHHVDFRLALNRLDTQQTNTLHHPVLHINSGKSSKIPSYHHTYIQWSRQLPCRHSPPPSHCYPTTPSTPPHFVPAVTVQYNNTNNLNSGNRMSDTSPAKTSATPPTATPNFTPPPTTSPKSTANATSTSQTPSPTFTIPPPRTPRPTQIYPLVSNTVSSHCLVNASSLEGEKTAVSKTRPSWTWRGRIPMDLLPMMSSVRT